MFKKRVSGGPQNWRESLIEWWWGKRGAQNRPNPFAELLHTKKGKGTGRLTDQPPKYVAKKNTKQNSIHVLKNGMGVIPQFVVKIKMN